MFVGEMVQFLGFAIKYSNNNNQSIGSISEIKEMGLSKCWWLLKLGEGYVGIHYIIPWPLCVL